MEEADSLVIGPDSQHKEIETNIIQETTMNHVELENLLSRAIEDGNRKSRKALEKARLASGSVSYLDFLRSQLGLTQNTASSSSPTSDADTVRRVRSLPRVAVAASLILESGWDFIDTRPRVKMVKRPEEVREFLEMIQDGRDMTWDEMHPKLQGLLGTIIDAWLAWTK